MVSRQMRCFVAHFFHQTRHHDQEPSWPLFCLLTSGCQVLLCAGVKWYGSIVIESYSVHAFRCFSDLFYVLQYSSNMIICEIVWTRYRNPYLFSWNLEARTEAAKGSASLLECILLHQPCKYEKMVCCAVDEKTKKNTRCWKILDQIHLRRPTIFAELGSPSILPSAPQNKLIKPTKWSKGVLIDLAEVCGPSDSSNSLLTLLKLELIYVWKHDAAHEPDCSHVEHFCETNYLNSPVHVSTVTVPVHCKPGMRNRVECKAWSVECKTVECRVWSVECGV